MVRKTYPKRFLDAIQPQIACEIFEVYLDPGYLTNGKKVSSKKLDQNWEGADRF